jgi:hypothetical protein
MAGGPANGICGPFCPEEKPDKPEIDCIITNFINFNASRRLWGPKCTYRSPKIVGTSTQPLIESCVGPGYITSGSALSRVLQLVGSTSAGSRFISFYGGISDVNAGLKNLEYVTDKGYNRLYRYGFYSMFVDVCVCTQETCIFLRTRVANLCVGNGFCCMFIYAYSYVSVYVHTRSVLSYG